eukprot:SAG22_NODE_879_length_6707_cov_14.725787_4_plen_114_part_00
MQYGTQIGSAFDETPIPYGIRDPDSRFSSWWDLLQIILLTYIAFAAPARMSFGVCLERFGFWSVWDILVDIYFIVDVCLNFFTAFWAKASARKCCATLRFCVVTGMLCSPKID